MRWSMLTALGIGVGLVLAATALAQDRPKAKRGRFDQQLFNRLDSNGDGVVTLDEVPQERRARVEKLIQRLDKNGDGKVTREEFEQGFARFRAGGQRPGGPGGRSGRGQAGGRFGRRGPGGLGGPPLFRLLDADHDQRLSRQELQQAIERLSKLDRNNDGYIDMRELMGAMRAAGGRGGPGRPGGRSPRPSAADLIRRADKDGDGKLSQDEVPERLRQRFDRIDANGDGFIDEQELKQAMARRRGGGRGERPPQ